MTHIAPQKLISLLPTDKLAQEWFLFHMCLFPPTVREGWGAWTQNDPQVWMSVCTVDLNACIDFYFFIFCFPSSLQPLSVTLNRNWWVENQNNIDKKACCNFFHLIPVFSCCCWSPPSQLYSVFEAILSSYFWQHIFIPHTVVTGYYSCQSQRRDMSLMSSFISLSWAFQHFELQIGFDKDGLRGAEITVRSVPLFCSLPWYL